MGVQALYSVKNPTRWRPYDADAAVPCHLVGFVKVSVFFLI
jgi:hypothetical protein